MAFPCPGSGSASARLASYNASYDASSPASFREGSIERRCLTGQGRPIAAAGGRALLLCLLFFLFKEKFAALNCRVRAEPQLPSSSALASFNLPLPQPQSNRAAWGGAAGAAARPGAGTHRALFGGAKPRRDGFDPQPHERAPIALSWSSPPPPCVASARRAPRAARPHPLLALQGAPSQRDGARSKAAARFLSAVAAQAVLQLRAERLLPRAARWDARRGCASRPSILPFFCSFLLSRLAQLL